MELADLCKQCGGKCCKIGPFFTIQEYTKMYQIVGDERVQAHHPKLLLGGWKFNDGCPALTESGCMLSYDDRPALCRSYPFQPVPAIDGSTMLLLSVKTCPHWKEFGEHYQEIIEELGL